MTAHPRVWFVGDTIPEQVTAIGERGGVHVWHAGDVVKLVHGPQVEVRYPDWKAEVAREHNRRAKATGRAEGASSFRTRGNPRLAREERGRAGE